MVKKRDKYTHLWIVKNYRSNVETKTSVYLITFHDIPLKNTRNTNKNLVKCRPQALNWRKIAYRADRIDYLKKNSVLITLP